jgi:hypothetical protein
VDGRDQLICELKYDSTSGRRGEVGLWSHAASELVPIEHTAIRSLTDEGRR